MSVLTEGVLRGCIDRECIEWECIDKGVINIECIVYGSVLSRGVY